MGRLLPFLTDDVWTLEFEAEQALPMVTGHSIQRSFFPLAGQSVAVTLQSGGLDSLLGVIEMVTNPTAEVVIPITVAGSHKIRHMSSVSVGKLLGSIEAAGMQLRHGVVDLHLVRGDRPLNDRERSWRARPLAFLAAGLALSSTVGAPILKLTENGIGAISLPMSGDHWGARASKAMHPYTLSLIASIASEIVGRKLTVQNSGLFLTKGTLASALLTQDAHFDAARATSSCDRAAYFGADRGCGVCTSCLLRRLALRRAGLEQTVDRPVLPNAKRYETDVFSDPVDLRSSKSVGLIAMSNQAVDVRAAIRVPRDAFVSLEEDYPDLELVTRTSKSLGMSLSEIQQGVVDLYSQHLIEVGPLLQRISALSNPHEERLTDWTQVTALAAAS